MAQPPTQLSWSQRNYGWPVILVPLLLGLYLVLFSCWPPLHKWRCPNHAGNAEYVLDSGVGEFRRATGIKVYLENHRLGSLGKKADERALGLRWRSLSDSVITAFDPLRGKPLGYVQFHWWRGPGILTTMFVPHEVLGVGPNAGIDAKKERSLGYKEYPQLWIRYPESDQRADNLANLEHLYQRLAARAGSMFPGFSPGLTLTKATGTIDYHFAHLLEATRPRILIAVGLTIIVVAIGYHFRQTRRAYRYLYILYRQHRAIGRRVRRPSLWLLNLSPRIEWYRQHYARLLSAAAVELTKNRKEARQAGVVRRLVDDLEHRLLPQVDAQLRDRAMTGEANQLWRTANDPSCALEVRVRAMWDVRGWAERQDHPRREALSPQSPDYRQRLLGRLALIRREDIPPAQLERFRQYLHSFREEETNPRRAIGDYWLGQALEAALAPEETEPPLESKTTAVAPTNGAAIRNFAEAEELFDVRDCLPPDIDHCHARAILIHGLYQLGKRDQLAVKDRYEAVNQVRQRVQGTLGGAYDPWQFRAALQFLVRTRVLLEKRKKHQDTVGLNPHARQAVGPGQEITRRLLTFIHHMKCTITA
ncbi:MAG: hypothetical protein HYY50_00250 [Candidatus Kerfeldbacteria bacterium]|nr:hypothetical protein [Candidatus Kerfeldbacteria bacterium]